MDRFICGLLQSASGTLGLDTGLSGTASEDRSDLPQPAIYSFQYEYSEYAFTRGCFPLYTVWMFRSPTS